METETKVMSIEDTTPKEILRYAWDCAKNLKAIISRRPNKVMINNRQYLQFEDWQTLGAFFKVTAKITDTAELREDGKLLGFVARAIAIKNGDEISAAEAECCFDEPNWTGKPRFQLRSMAQTRAAAKALRNCLSWIAVLGGFVPQVAEEQNHRQSQEELF